MNAYCDHCGGHVSEVGRLYKFYVHNYKVQKLCRLCRKQAKIAEEINAEGLLT